MKNIDKHYVSVIDQKLLEFDRTHPKTNSQLAEIKKYQRITYLRDHNDLHPQPHSADLNFWEKF